ncbi:MULTISPECIES: LysE family transporter [Amycolatopsis]|uniref:LysE family transporter n=1 Tax=Amycolatopsis TaxID=1813 RepID=UPI0023DDF972|nr:MULTISPECIES: LysE family transporter [Amycolatopsis]
MIRHRKGVPGEVPAGGVTGRRAFLTSLLNPKMVTYTIALLPQFIDPALGRVWLQFAILIAMEFLVDGTVGVLAGAPEPRLATLDIELGRLLGSPVDVVPARTLEDDAVRSALADAVEL